MARQWVYDMCRREWQRVSSQLGLPTTTDLTFVVGTMPRLMGGVILLLWRGTCSLQLAGNSGQGANLSGLCLKTLRRHIGKTCITWLNLSKQWYMAKTCAGICRSCELLICTHVRADTCSAAGEATYTSCLLLHSERGFVKPSKLDLWSSPVDPAVLLSHACQHAVSFHFGGSKLKRNRSLHLPLLSSMPKTGW